jgi:hypothetical protein
MDDRHETWVTRIAKGQARLHWDAETNKIVVVLIEKPAVPEEGA